MMHIGVPEIRATGEMIEYSVLYSLTPGNDRSLNYQLEVQHNHLISPRSDAALVALLIPAMCVGGDLHVEGPVTEELVYQLNQSYQEILRLVIPSLKRIRILPDQPVPAGERAPGVATGFSAGVDSFTVLADHFYDHQVPASLRLTHLLFNNVSGHGSGDSGRAAFKKRNSRAISAAKKVGLPLITVDSNLDQAFDGLGLSFQRTHTPRNASVAFLLQRGIGTWLYASTYAYPTVRVTESDDMGYTDPIALPVLSTSALQLASSGSEYRRFDKTTRIAEIPDTYASLDICVQPNHDGDHTNCSKCWKCMRTLLTLEIAGILDRYADSFDLREYEQQREQYIKHLRQSIRPNDQELVQEATKRGFRIPQTPLHRVLFARLDRATKGQAGRYRRAFRLS